MEVGANGWWSWVPNPYSWEVKVIESLLGTEPEGTYISDGLGRGFASGALVSPRRDKVRTYPSQRKRGGGYTPT